MPDWLTYKGLEVPYATPTGVGGANLKDDLTELADRTGPVHTDTIDPDADNDGVDTAAIGTEFFVWSKWLNTSTGAIWICSDNATSAAIWERVDNGGIEIVTDTSPELGGHLNCNGKDIYWTEVDNGNSGSSKTIDFTTGHKQKLTLTANCTLTLTPPAGNTNVLLRLVQGGSGSYVITWPGTVLFPGGAAPTLSSAVGTKILFPCIGKGQIGLLKPQLDLHDMAYNYTILNKFSQFGATYFDLILKDAEGRLPDYRVTKKIRRPIAQLNDADFATLAVEEVQMQTAIAEVALESSAAPPVDFGLPIVEFFQAASPQQAAAELPVFVSLLQQINPDIDQRGFAQFTAYLDQKYSD